ncbi:MAG TPA: hypothetical protein VGE52_13070 [Pirellulales bacterium]
MPLDFDPFGRSFFGRVVETIGFAIAVCVYTPLGFVFGGVALVAAAAGAVVALLLSR